MNSRMNIESIDTKQLIVQLEESFRLGALIGMVLVSDSNYNYSEFTQAAVAAELKRRATQPEPKKARIRVSAQTKNRITIVEYCDLDTGKTMGIPFGDCRVFEVDQTQADRLWHEIDWENSEDGRIASDLDDEPVDDGG
jgi:hypothetical protein